MTGFPLKSFRCRKRGRHMMEKASVLGWFGNWRRHQREDQKLLFKAEYGDGATLKNIILNAPVAAGVHTYSNVKISFGIMPAKNGQKRKRDN